MTGTERDREKINYMKEKMKRWLAGHPDATAEEAFVDGWMLCTEAWCHGKREKMEQVCELIKEIIDEA